MEQKFGSSARGFSSSMNNFWPGSSRISIFLGLAQTFSTEFGFCGILTLTHVHDYGTFSGQLSPAAPIIITQSPKLHSHFIFKAVSGLSSLLAQGESESHNASFAMLSLSTHEWHTQKATWTNYIKKERERKSPGCKTYINITQMPGQMSSGWAHDTMDYSWVQGMSWGRVKSTTTTMTSSYH